MNRKLLVNLLRKDIQELDMITEGFMEMNEYPKAIILLAQRKTEDIQAYIQQLADIKKDLPASDESSVIREEAPVKQAETTPAEIEFAAETVVETNTEEYIQEEIIGVPEFISEAILPEDIFNPETTEEPGNSIIIEPEELLIDEPEIEPTIEEPDELLISEPEIQPVILEPKKSILEEKVIPPSRNDILSKADNSLGSLLANKKINDIKQAINIGDRFRFQRELFRGNGEDMNKTLNYINQLATLVEVQSFLQSKYNWVTENETVEDFFQIVRRRFL